MLVFGEGRGLSELLLLLLDVEAQHLPLGRDQASFFIWSLIHHLSSSCIGWSFGAIALVHEGTRMRSLGLLSAILKGKLKLHCISQSLLTMRSRHQGATTLFNALSALQSRTQKPRIVSHPNERRIVFQVLRWPLLIVAKLLKKAAVFAVMAGGRRRYHGVRHAHRRIANHVHHRLVIRVQLMLRLFHQRLGSDDHALVHAVGEARLVHEERFEEVAVAIANKATLRELSWPGFQVSWPEC